MTEPLSDAELAEVRHADAEFWRVMGPPDPSWDRSAEGQRNRLIATIDALRPAEPRTDLRAAVSRMRAAVYGDDDVPRWFDDCIEGIVRAATPVESPKDDGLDVERLARAAHASYERDPNVKRIVWDDLGEWDKRMWKNHAAAIAREYAALDLLRDPE